MPGSPAWNSNYDWMGYSVATTTTGDKVAAGAPNFNSGEGRVAVYPFSAASKWGTNRARKDVSNPVSGMQDRFGEAVSISGDGSVLAVGARLAGKANPSAAGPGRVYVYNWDGTDWQLGATLSGDSNNDHFGVSVQLDASGSVLAVSAPFKDVSSNVNAGVVRGASAHALCRPRGVA